MTTTKPPRSKLSLLRYLPTHVLNQVLHPPPFHVRGVQTHGWQLQYVIDCLPNYKPRKYQSPLNGEKFFISEVVHLRAKLERMDIAEYLKLKEPRPFYQAWLNQTRVNDFGKHNTECGIVFKHPWTQKPYDLLLSPDLPNVIIDQLRSYMDVRYEDMILKHVNCMKLKIMPELAQASILYPHVYDEFPEYQALAGVANKQLVHKHMLARYLLPMLDPYYFGCASAQPLTVCQSMSTEEQVQKMLTGDHFSHGKTDVFLDEQLTVICSFNAWVMFQTLKFERYVRAERKRKRKRKAGILFSTIQCE